MPPKNKYQHYGELLSDQSENKGIEKWYIQRFFMTGVFPHRDPKTRDYSIRDGYKKVTVSSGLDLNDLPIGIPYGSLPRLFMAYICTQAVRHREKKILLGKNLAVFLRELDLHNGGGPTGDITRVKKQLRKFVNVSISYRIETNVKEEAGGYRLTEKSVLFKGKNLGQEEILDSYIILQDEFMCAILAQSVPLSMKVLKALKQSPLALDLYMWLTARVYSPHMKNSFVSYNQIMNQCGGEYSNIYEFGRNVRAKLKTISRIWPELHYKEQRGGIKLLSSSQSHIKPKNGKR